MNPYAEDEEAQIAALQSELEATKSALKVYQIYGARCSVLTAERDRLKSIVDRLTAELDGERTLTYDLIRESRAHCIRAVELTNERDALTIQNSILTKENAALHTIIDELNADNAARKIPGESKEHQFYVKTGKVT